jgi:hypothetical protein
MPPPIKKETWVAGKQEGQAVRRIGSYLLTTVVGSLGAVVG